MSDLTCNNSIEYEKIKDMIKPFDLIAFRGGDFISDLISFVQEKYIGVGNFTHVGMAVTRDILPSLPDDDIYVFESTCSYEYITDGVPDIKSKKGVLGVQLRNLKDVISNYIKDEKTKIAWCKLINNPYDNENNRESLKNIFIEQYEKYNSKFYEVSAISLLSAVFPELRELREIKDDFFDSIFGFISWFKDEPKIKTSPSGWQFCSELVANIYKKIRIISENFDSKNVIPVDFFGHDLDGIPAIVDKPIFIKNIS